MNATEIIVKNQEELREKQLEKAKAEAVKEFAKELSDIAALTDNAYEEKNAK